MKTSQALYEALEAVSELQQAMFEDRQDLQTMSNGVKWLDNQRYAVAQAHTLLENMRDSLNEGD